ncbi:MAG: cytochrome c3 family protein [Acidobacteriota bacterium]
MRKLFVSLSVLALLAGTAAFAVTAKDAPEKVTIKDCAAKKPAVEFPHKAHIDSGLACATCHHTQKDLKAGAAEEVKPCSACHVTPEKAETPKCSEMSPTKNPFHITCMGCHKEEVAKKADSKAPTKCDQCHKKPA